MKLGYTAEEGAGRGEEEAWLQDTEAEQETSGWRRTVPGSTNRLIDKRQAMRFTFNLSAAVAFVHSSRVIHRD